MGNESKVPRLSFLFLGFGPYAETAVRMLRRRREHSSSIFVLAETKEEASRALALALPVEFREAFASGQLPAADRVIIDLQCDEKTLAVVRQTRIAGEVFAVVKNPQTIKELRSLATIQAICPAALTGRSLAASVLSF